MTMYTMYINQKYRVIPMLRRIPVTLGQWCNYTRAYQITHQVEKKENVPGTTDHFSGKFLYEYVQCEKLITFAFVEF